MLTSVRNRYVELEVRILILKCIRATQIAERIEMLTRVGVGGGGVTKEGEVAVLLKTFKCWILCVQKAYRIYHHTVLHSVSRMSLSHTLI